MNYTQHPLSAAYPAMPKQDFAALVDDIRAHGQHDAVTLYEGMVLDGWHRYRACEQIGIPCRIDEFAGSDPAAFVISKNTHRRQLTESQRAAAVVAVRSWRPADELGKPANRSTGAHGHPSATVAQMAAEAGVGEHTIQRAKKAHEAGLGEAIRDGKLSVRAAERAIAGKPSPAARPDGAEDAPEAQLGGAVDAPEPQGRGTVVAAEPRKRGAEPEHDLEDAVQALAEENAELREEIDTLKRAADPDQAKKVAELKSYIKAVERQRDDWMGQCAQLKREIKALHRKFGVKS